MSADRSKNRAKNVNIFGSYSANEWENLKAKYNFKCLSCGKKEPEVVLTADHIVPISNDNSSNYIFNIQPLCRTCNSAKGDKILDYRPVEDSTKSNKFNFNGLTIKIFEK